LLNKVFKEKLIRWAFLAKKLKVNCHFTL